MRIVEKRLRDLADRFSAIMVIGPGEAGKTTLCRAVFPDHGYVSLELPDAREFAIRDPRGFLREYRAGAVIDGIELAPGLPGHLSEVMEDNSSPGRFVFTGSRRPVMSEDTEAALKNRVGYQYLLPMSLDELRRFPSAPDDLWSTIWMGGYPRIHERRMNPNEWMGEYFGRFVQRDVLQTLRVADPDRFVSFCRLAAGRTSLERNLSALAGGTGVSHPTIRSWLSVLETSQFLFSTPAGRPNPRRRAVKADRLHFVDSGLACYLLGIRDPEQLRVHPLRGALFESWVASEVRKARLHRGLPAGLWHLREDRWLSVGLISEGANRRMGVEVRPSETILPEFARGLTRFLEEASGWDPALPPAARLVYAGDQARTLSGVEVIPWFWVQDVDWH
ncbi:MAG: DUF4143 domain-containing protein [Gemmatimonadota bacterium]|jgi:predicted AAA+ superfamily ATPase|nr:DUF4143 domain-containing protein [Gemmatimonadota bacterium]